jgi:short-subunit dehydrogenase
MKKVLILGATSGIARAIATELANRGSRLFLAGRDLQELERAASDLRTRYQVEVLTGEVEAEQYSIHSDFIDRVVEGLHGLDGVVFAIGLLGSQPDDSNNPEPAARIVGVNLTSAVSLVGAAANYMETQGQGFIVGLSSVAGDRGRQSNYVYGAAKAGFSTYLQGLRNRLEGKGVRVYTLKLGFVDTAMTYGMDGLFLVASPEQIAASTLKILGKSSGIYYLPGFWRWIMLFIRMIPERVFKKLSL